MFVFSDAMATDRASYHTRSEKSEQSSRLTAEKIISSKYYDQAVVINIMDMIRLCYSGSQRKAILSPST